MDENTKKILEEARAAAANKKGGAKAAPAPRQPVIPQIKPEKPPEPPKKEIEKYLWRTAGDGTVTLAGKKFTSEPVEVDDEELVARLERNPNLFKKVPLYKEEPKEDGEVPPS